MNFHFKHVYYPFIFTYVIGNFIEVQTAVCVYKYNKFIMLKI